MKKERGRAASCAFQRCCSTGLRPVQFGVSPNCSIAFQLQGSHSTFRQPDFGRFLQNFQTNPFWNSAQIRVINHLQGNRHAIPPKNEPIFLPVRFPLELGIWNFLRIRRQAQSSRVKGVGDQPVLPVQIASDICKGPPCCGWFSAQPRSVPNYSNPFQGGYTHEHLTLKSINACAKSTGGRPVWFDCKRGAGARSRWGIPSHSKLSSPSTAMRASAASPNPARAQCVASNCAIR